MAFMPQDLLVLLKLVTPCRTRWSCSCLAADPGMSPSEVHAAVKRAMTAPYFLATKLEALARRGRGAYQASPDLVNIVTLIDGRAEIVGEVVEAEPDLHRLLAGRRSRGPQ